MRTTKELLIVVRDNLERCIARPTIGSIILSHAGICSVIDQLRYEKLITERESYHLNKYLKANKPRNASLRYKKYHLLNVNEFDIEGWLLWAHWWVPGKIKPRLRYLNKLIEKL